MGLALSGPKVCELLVISTDEFELCIKGVPRNRVVEAFELHQDSDGERRRAGLVVTGDCQAVRVYDPDAAGGLTDYSGGGVLPCFFERTNYEMVVERRDGCEVELGIEHLNKKLRDAVTPTGRGGRVLSGILNFNDEVGFSRFEVVDGDGRCLVGFEIEVFPGKLDYGRDFGLLLAEVNEEVYNLAFDFLMKTSFAAALRSEERPSAAEIFYIAADFIHVAR